LQDEVFHVRQAQRYCAGNLDVWDPKITTPPGLYWISYAFARVLGCDIFALRAVNAIGLTTLLLAVWISYRARNPDRFEEGHSRLLIQHSALNTVLFPPLFFFSALYYTDVLSTLFTIIFYMVFFDSHQRWVPGWARFALLVPLGIVSLMFRQTNIFWVAIFPAGLVLVHHLDQGHEVVKKSMLRGADGFGDSLWSIAKTSWKMNVVYDPPVRDAWLEGKTTGASSVS